MMATNKIAYNRVFVTHNTKKANPTETNTKTNSKHLAVNRIL